MQTKYYLSFEQVGIIRRIPLKEQDPDMQGILDAFIKAFRIANELGDASKCVRNLLQIVQYNDTFDLAANNLAFEIKNSVGFHWRQLNPGSSTPEPEFIKQFYEEVINRLKTKI